MIGACAALAASAIRSAPLLAAELPSEGAPNAISPDAALERLMQGNERYAANTPREKIFPPAARRGPRRNSPSRRMYGDSPILSEALAAKTIGASGGVYDIATGKINLMQ